jgi:23S rRNA (guanosine2251-2'-O)-methyltransferase
MDTSRRRKLRESASGGTKKLSRAFSCPELFDLERIPYQVTSAAANYPGFDALPVRVLLEDIRSLYNVGAFFRTCDAAGIESLDLCGITGAPPHKEIHKTALGAEETVRWKQYPNAVVAAQELRAAGYEIAAVETTLRAVDLFNWRPRFPVVIAFGNEVDGLSPALSELCDTHVRIPMLGRKHSLNVATAGGVVIYELLRKYRDLVSSNICHETPSY